MHAPNPSVSLSVSLYAPPPQLFPSERTAPIGELICIESFCPNFLPADAAFAALLIAVDFALPPPSIVERIASERVESAWDQTVRQAA